MTDYQLELYKLSEERMNDSLREMESIKARMKYMKNGYELNVANRNYRNHESTYETNSYIYKSLKYEIDKKKV